MKYTITKVAGKSITIRPNEGIDQNEKSFLDEKFEGGERWFALRENNILEDGDRMGTYKLAEIVPQPSGNSDPFPDIDRNPYNFVRLPGTKPWLEEPEPALGKHHGHETWDSRLLHGHIDLTLTARNPLFVPKWIERSVGEEDKESTEFYKLHKWTEEGRIQLCAIPGSSLKGALRAMVEALANDRFGVVDDRKHYSMPIPYRRRVFNDLGKPEYHVGIAKCENHIWLIHVIEYKKIRDEAGRFLKKRYRSNLLIQDAEHTECTDTPISNVTFRIPDHIVDEYRNNLCHPHYEQHYKDWNKRYEEYKRKLRDWNRAGANPTTKPKSPDKPRYSGSIYCATPEQIPQRVAQIRNEMELKDGDTVFFTMDPLGKIDSFGKNMNYLWPARYSVENLAGEWFPPLPSEKQLGLGKRLGLAERMFGFVSDHDKDSHPFRGKLRFEPTWADSNAGTVNIERLPMVMAPKSRGKCRPLYLVGRPDEFGVLRSASYSDSEKPSLRGRKFYWKQRPHDGQNDVWEGHKDPSAVTHVINALPAGTIFKTRIHFENLSEPELGVLIYALLGVDWQPDGSPGFSSGSHTVHLGKYKPRGLGACQVRIDALCFRNPASEYASLVGPFPPPETCDSARIDRLRGSFRHWCLHRAKQDGGSETAVFEQMSYIKDFRNLHLFPASPTVRYYPQNWSQYSWLPNENKNPDEPKPPKKRPKAMKQAKDLIP